MAKTQLSRQELLGDVRRLKSDIGKQTKVLKEMGLSAPSPAVSSWEKLKKNMPSNPDALSTKDLRALRRDLLYIKDLKTYTKRGYTSYQIRFRPVQSALDAMPEDKRDEFWEAYNKLYNENPSRGKKEYKYDLFMEISDRIKMGINADDIVRDIIEEGREEEIRRRNEIEDGGVGYGTTITHTRRTNNVRIYKTKRKQSSTRAYKSNDSTRRNTKRKKR